MVMSTASFATVNLFGALLTGTMARSIQGLCALIACALLILCCASSIEGNMRDICKIGITTPMGDINLEYGKVPLIITCSIIDPSTIAANPNISNIMFYTKGGVEVQNMTRILNSTSIQLYDEHPLKSNQLYTCKLRGPVKERHEHLCWNDVSIGVKPYNVTDLKCISNNFDNLTCSWTPLNTVVSTQYNLTFEFRPKLHFSKEFECPKLEYPGEYEPQSQKIRCVLDLTTNPQYRLVQPLYNFKLRMANEFGEYTTTYEFNHFKNVRSGPPERLEAVNTTTSSIYLNWSIPNSMVTFPKALQYRVVYTCEYGPKNKWLPGGENNGTITVLKHTDAVYYYNLTGLAHSHAVCDIRVAIRSEEARDDESMWSTHASITVRTSSRLPGAPPNTTVGSFEISFTEIETVTDFTRSEVYIYWQQIDDAIKNGEDFHYETTPLVQYSQPYGEHEPLALKELTSAYAKYGNLVLSNTYKFAVYSKNSLGRSERHSVVIVPAQSLRPKEPGSFTKVSFGHGVYELKWEPAAHDDGINRSALTGYTLFWCSNDRDRPYQCTGHLDWIHLPANVTSHRLTVVENKQITQFAITSNTGEHSSGMLWASCTILHDKYVGKIRDFWINNVGSTHIEVGWKLACSERIGNVVGYNIHYCPIKSPKETICKGDKQKQSIDGDENLIHGRITGLIPYTTYMLKIAVITASAAGGSLSNKTSQVSDALYNTTLEGVPTAPLNLAVTGVTNSSIALTWDSPLYSNGVLKYYKIQYNEQTREVGPGSAKSNITFDLKALQSHILYNITVKACTTDCSDPSNMVPVTTKMGYPGTIASIDKRFQNDSYVLVTWPLPNPPRGEINYYQLNIKQEVAYNNETLPIVNSSEPKYAVTHCGDNNRYNTFYMSVRAVNVIEGATFPGPWTDEIKFFCKTPPSSIFWLIFSTVMAVFVALLLWLSRRCYYHYKDMKNVEVKLPPGLATTNIGDGLPYWTEDTNHHMTKNSNGNLTLSLNISGSNNIQQTTILPIHNIYKDSPQQQQLHHHQQPIKSDEELVLLKMNSHESDRDSSGCSTGHDSGSASLHDSAQEDEIDIDVEMAVRGWEVVDEEVARNGDRCSSDSGTDQANSNSTNSLNKTSSLRLRKPTTSQSDAVASGYITVPPDLATAIAAAPQTTVVTAPAPLWSIMPTSVPSNSYCMLGIDPATASTAGVNDSVTNIGHQSTNAGYVSFDSQQPPPPPPLVSLTSRSPVAHQQQVLPRPAAVSLPHGIKNAVANVSNGSGYIPLMHGDPSDTENDLATSPPATNLFPPPQYVLASTKQTTSTKLSSPMKPQEQEQLLPSLITVNIAAVPSNAANKQQTADQQHQLKQQPQQVVPAYVQAAPMSQAKMSHPIAAITSAIVDQVNQQLSVTSPGYVSVANVAQPDLEQHKAYVPHRQINKHE